MLSSGRSTEDHGRREGSLSQSRPQPPEMTQAEARRALASPQGMEFRRSWFTEQPAGEFVSTEHENEMIRHAHKALEAGDLATFLGAFQEIGMTPPPRTTLCYGTRALLAGRLADGLRAYDAVGVRPERGELLACAERADADGDEAVAVKARCLAREAPDDESPFETALSWFRRVVRR